MAVVQASVTVNLSDMPRTLALLRKELADILRAQGEGEPAFIRRKLDRCAAVFETGIREDEADGR